MGLGEGDQPEHLPYVRAGLAVVAYEVDGHLPDTEYPSDSAVARAFAEYKASMAGLVNARNAIAYALAQMPEVNPNRLYTAGHSSAARQALLLAEHEPRIKGVVAYNAVADVVGDVGLSMFQLEAIMPGAREFLTRSSPLTHVGRLNCAVRIFHSEGDSRVPVSQARDFFAQLPGQAQPRELHIVPGGDHYNSMVQQGLPAGVEWLTMLERRLGGNPTPPTASWNGPPADRFPAPSFAPPGIPPHLPMLPPHPASFAPPEFTPAPRSGH
jgi:dienelactone hydrolase